jgi:hypothetical protein
MQTLLVPKARAATVCWNLYYNTFLCSGSSSNTDLFTTFHLSSFCYKFSMSFFSLSYFAKKYQIIKDAIRSSFLADASTSWYVWFALYNSFNTQKKVRKERMGCIRGRLRPKNISRYFYVSILLVINWANIPRIAVTLQEEYLRKIIEQIVV